MRIGCLALTTLEFCVAFVFNLCFEIVSQTLGIERLVQKELKSEALRVCLLTDLHVSSSWSHEEVGLINCSLSLLSQQTVHSFFSDFSMEARCLIPLLCRWGCSFRAVPKKNYLTINNFCPINIQKKIRKG